MHVRSPRQSPEASLHFRNKWFQLAQRQQVPFKVLDDELSQALRVHIVTTIHNVCSQFH